jgi:hypothetical protein
MASADTKIQEMGNFAQPIPRRGFEDTLHSRRLPGRCKIMKIFINGKQKRVPRPQLVEGLPVGEFIAQNADPIWLHQNELWELMTPEDERLHQNELWEPMTPDDEI